MSEQLSEHFSVEEFEYSDTAVAYKISNKMTGAQKKEASHFCTYVLEPMRNLFTQKYGKVSVKLTSGFRSAALNSRVGGSKTSQHSKAQAADIWVYKYNGTKKVQIPVEDTFNDILSWVKEGKLTVDQCIYEVATKSGKVTTKWVHISGASQLAQNRKMFLSYKNGSYKLVADL